VFEYRPFILKAKRDFCIVRHWFRRKDGAYIMAGRSVQHPLCPPARWVNREDVLPSGYLIKAKDDDPQSSIVTFVLQYDWNTSSRVSLQALSRRPLQIAAMRKILQTGRSN